MGNIIRLSEDYPREKWLSMSNQGTDLFLDLLLHAAEPLRKTPSQEKLIGFLSDQKEINEVSPGNAGFDVDEMPWSEDSLREDADFLIILTKDATTSSVVDSMPYGIRSNIVFPWLESFADMIRDKRDGVTYGNEEQDDGSSKVEADYCFRILSDLVRFGCGYRTIDGKRQYFAFHGYPSKDDDLFTTSEITEREYRELEMLYPVTIQADRDTAEVFRNRYVDGHRVLLEGWNRLIEPPKPSQEKNDGKTD